MVVKRDKAIPWSHEPESVGTGGQIPRSVLDRWAQMVRDGAFDGMKAAKFPEADLIVVVSRETLERLKGDGWQEDGVR